MKWMGLWMVMVVFFMVTTGCDSASDTQIGRTCQAMKKCETGLKIGFQSRCEAMFQKEFGNGMKTCNDEVTAMLDCIASLSCEDMSNGNYGGKCEKHMTQFAVCYMGFGKSRTAELAED